MLIVALTAGSIVYVLWVLDAERHELPRTGDGHVAASTGFSTYRGAHERSMPHHLDAPVRTVAQVPHR